MRTMLVTQARKFQGDYDAILSLGSCFKTWNRSMMQGDRYRTRSRVKPAALPFARKPTDASSTSSIVMFPQLSRTRSRHCVRRLCRGLISRSHRGFSSSEPTIRPYLDNDATTTHFGFSDVPVEEKQAKVRQVFAKVADQYDLMNDAMSAGLHRLWKDYLLDVSQVQSIAKIVRRNHTTRSSSSTDSSPPTFRILDVAGGTGDVAFRFVDASGCAERAASSGTDPIHITVCDINADMLRVGRARAQKRYGPAILDNSQALSFVEGNAQDLAEFEDNSYDIYTIAFGLRNVTDVDQALREARRVLKPGGRFFCLEFSQVPNAVLRQAYDAYSFHVIPAMGQALVGDRDSYQYLVESIRKFPAQEELQQRMESAGFEQCKYTNLTGGVVALHEGFKSI